jgi:allophanate hydrolase subunit 2
LSGLGPPRLIDGTVLPIGADSGPSADLAPAVRPPEVLDLAVRLGPRDSWFAPGELFASSYRLSPVSNRVGARLDGPSLTRVRDGELPPEGLVLGAIQVPANGQPLIFLADHPTTGGYPVIGVVDDVTPLAQARPGTVVRFGAYGGSL